MTTPTIPADLSAAATHGSYCPKMCTFACPVSEATGRDDSVPWSFHRVTADLADGRLGPGAAAPRLTACTGCLRCQDACTSREDVPAQVLAARAAAPPAGAADALEHLRAGRRPDGSAPPARRGTETASVVVVAGDYDDDAMIDATLMLLAAAGIAARAVAPVGSGGDTARALGDPALGARHEAALASLLADAEEVVVLDPHVLAPAVRSAPDALVRDVASALAAVLDRLPLRPGGAPITWHDPCVLARPDGLIDAPRALLAAIGGVVEPEHHGRATFCAGGGLEMPRLDPEAAAATADLRARHLDAAGARAATSCRRAADLLRARGAEVVDLVLLLAESLENA